MKKMNIIHNNVYTLQHGKYLYKMLLLNTLKGSFESCLNYAITLCARRGPPLAFRYFFYFGQILY